MRRGTATLVAVILAVTLAALGGSAWWWSHRRASPPRLPGVVAFELGVYLLPTATGDPRQAVADAVRAGAVFETGVGELGPSAGRLRVLSELVDDVGATYAPPEGQALDLFGRGLTDGQRQALGRSRQALRLRFGIPRERALTGLREACRLASAVARRTEGLLWDEETREVFNPETWDEWRVDPWPEGAVPDVSRHIVIHSYRDGDFLRAVTLGMVKLGLPDLVVENFASSNERSVGHLINLTAQRLAEGAPARAGDFKLRITDIRHPEVRTTQLSALEPNAKSEVVLRLREGRPEEGDAANHLLEIGFDHYPGPDVRARQDRLLSTLLGWKDAVTEVDHDDALLAASRLAREQLPAMKAIAAAGFQPGQLLMVKAPFAKPDGGNEWMWVEVVAWKGRRIRGVLANEPFDVAGLRAGQEVVVSEADVFDYVLQNPDGTTEGNETGRIIEERQRRNEAAAGGSE